MRKKKNIQTKIFSFHSIPFNLITFNLDCNLRREEEREEGKKKRNPIWKVTAML
jgi:hypothetical protein